MNTVSLIHFHGSTSREDRNVCKNSVNAEMEDFVKSQRLKVSSESSVFNDQNSHMLLIKQWQYPQQGHSLSIVHGCIVDVRQFFVLCSLLLA